MLQENTLLVEYWIAAVLIVILLLTSYLLFNIFKNSSRIGKAISCIGILMFAVAVFIYLFANLNMVMNKEGISYQYFPFVNKTTSISWKNIKNIEIIKFNALSEFGGYGNKYSPIYGRGYLTKGEYGLFITDKTNAKTTITILDTVTAQKILMMYYRN